MKLNKYIITLLIFMSTILSFSYAIFFIYTERYKLDNIFNGEILFSYYIEDNDVNLVNNREIVVSAGNFEIININVFNLNNFDSQFLLLYKIKCGQGEVYYIDKENKPFGIIGKGESNEDFKTIKLVIKNTGNEDLIVSFKVNGSLLYNNFNFSEDLDGYIKISYNNSIASNTNVLAWTLNGVDRFDSFPRKGEGFMVESIICTNNASAYWDYESWGAIIENISKTTRCTVNFVDEIFLYEQILSDNPNIVERTDFSTIFTTSNNGNTIYKASGQDGKDTYYFAGNVTNNYVEFGGYYWRIVRINEDNSVRLIYAGVSTGDTSAFINTSQAYNTSANNSAYVGYMYTLNEQYGVSTNSSVKTAIDNWYSSNLNNYDEYISKTAIYCSDRHLETGSWASTGATNFNYAPYTRVQANKNPSFLCENVNDRFTASVNVGNGLLKYPVGLITVDEVSYSGGLVAVNNNNFYLADNAKSNASTWWTMSPARWASSSARTYYVGGSTNTGRLAVSQVDNSRAVRPVISLKACVLFNSGDGTASNPYKVAISEECKTVENEIPKAPVRVSATTNDVKMATVVSPSNVTIENGSNYTFNFNVNGGYKFIGVSNCDGVYDVENNSLTLANVDKNTECVVNFMPICKEGSLCHQILSDNPNVKTRSDFSVAFTTSNNGNTIYKASGEDDKETYYFAGSVTNNYVSFAGYYWRIVRINEDNSVRLIYAGKRTNDTAAFINSGIYYSSDFDNSSYVGYMYTLNQQYGMSINSLAKVTLDSWYKTNLSSFDNYISKTAVYCSDRSMESGSWTATGKVFFTYSAASRLEGDIRPTYVCENVNDKFTVSKSTGNGVLSYPIGLITADEVAYAGGIFGVNNNYYIYENAKSGSTWWWTMTPAGWDGTDAFMFAIGASDSSNAGSYDTRSIGFQHAIRPVISLKGCIEWDSGNGTASNPYVVKLNSECKTSDN